MPLSRRNKKRWLFNLFLNTLNVAHIVYAISFINYYHSFSILSKNNYFLLNFSLLYSQSQFQRSLYCFKGSYFVMSSIKTRTFVLQICLKNQKPRPLFLCASQMIPGISAIDIAKSSTNLTKPIEGFKVVNQQLAIFGKALETAAKNVDFPMLGSPTKPTSAKVFSYKKMIFDWPYFPSFCILELSTYQLIKGCFLFPLPAYPPLTIVICQRFASKSATKSFVQFYYSFFIQQTVVPQGTLMIVFPPFLPSFPLGPNYSFIAIYLHFYHLPHAILFFSDERGHVKNYALKVQSNHLTHLTRHLDCPYVHFCSQNTRLTHCLLFQHATSIQFDQKNISFRISMVDDSMHRLVMLSKIVVLAYMSYLLFQ